MCRESTVAATLQTVLVSGEATGRYSWLACCAGRCVCATLAIRARHIAPRLGAVMFGAG